MSNNINDNKENELLKGQAVVYNHLFAYAKTLALRSAVELRIADIIHDHGHGQPMRLSEIASKLESPNPPHLPWLERLMRMLVRMQIFTIHYYNQSSSSEAMYGLTTASKWLLHDQELSLAPVILALCDHSFVKPWFEISRSIKDGESPFVKAHGESLYEMTAHNDEFKNMFNLGMASCTKPILDAVINKGYKEGFSKLEGTIVDVGGGIGILVAKIVETYPHIKGINFDLPAALANAPDYPGITHVGGDMFQHIPPADNIIIKSTLHNWTDESCMKILRNCRKALLDKAKGRVIIVDMVLDPFGSSMFDDSSVAVDLLMMISSPGGRERTEDDWNKLLKEADFNRITFIPLPTIMSLSVIEAFV